MVARVLSSLATGRCKATFAGMQRVDGLHGAAEPGGMSRSRVAADSEAGLESLPQRTATTGRDVVREQA